MQVNTNF